MHINAIGYITTSVFVFSSEEKRPFHLLYKKVSTLYQPIIIVIDIIIIIYLFIFEFMQRSFCKCCREKPKLIITGNFFLYIQV